MKLRKKEVVLLWFAIGLLVAFVASIAAASAANAGTEEEHLHNLPPEWENFLIEHGHDMGWCLTECGYTVADVCQKTCVANLIAGHHPHCPSWCSGNEDQERCNPLGLTKPAN